MSRVRKQSCLGDGSLERDRCRHSELAFGAAAAKVAVGYFGHKARRRARRERDPSMRVEAITVQGDLCTTKDIEAIIAVAMRASLTSIFRSTCRRVRFKAIARFG